MAITVLILAFIGLGYLGQELWQRRMSRLQVKLEAHDKFRDVGPIVVLEANAPRHPDPLTELNDGS